MPSKISPKEGMLEADEFRIRYLEKGNGEPVIVFPDVGREPFDSLAVELASRRRVIALESPAAGAKNFNLAGKLAHGLSRAGIGHYAVIGNGQGSVAAIAHAIAAPGEVNRLILLSPTPALGQAELSFDLVQVNAPTLVIVGASDRSATVEAARLCRDKIRICHLSLVYGASQAVAADRLEVCRDLIVEFLEQGEQFVIFRESQAIRP